MLREDEWAVLVDTIKRRQCTPILGAGVSYPVLPLGGEIAEDWAKEFGYPFGDTTNLTRVAQFVALKRDRMTPKHLILDRFKRAALPNFADPNEPYRTLADLQLPVYVTTNYDPFMAEALRYRHWDVQREFYRWNKYLKEYLTDTPSIFQRDKSYTPSPARPLVFHLHGNDQEPQSLVLIEDDYIDFLINTSQKEYTLPLTVKRALTGQSLLFIGYSIADWNFRVLLGSLNQNLGSGSQRLNVAVMPPPKGPENESVKTQEYLTKYYEEIKVQVHWATARDFCAELRRRLSQPTS